MVEEADGGAGGVVFLFHQKFPKRTSDACAYSVPFSQGSAFLHAGGAGEVKEVETNSPVHKLYFYLRKPLVITSLFVKHLSAYVVLRK